MKAFIGVVVVNVLVILISSLMILKYIPGWEATLVAMLLMAHDVLLCVATILGLYYTAKKQ